MKDFFELTQRSQSALSKALNSLAGRESNGLLDHFNVYSARHINLAADGFILLRKEGRIEASRLLVRPAIEAMFRILAVRANPELLARIAFTEHLEDKKWARPHKPKEVLDHEFDDQFKKKWEDFRQLYAKQFPEHAINECKLSTRDAADAASVVKYYDSHYRLFCRHSHAALSAMSGHLESLGGEDERAMAGCTITGIEAVVASGGVCQDLEALRSRLIKA